MVVAIVLVTNTLLLLMSSQRRARYSYTNVACREAGEEEEDVGYRSVSDYMGGWHAGESPQGENSPTLMPQITRKVRFRYQNKWSH